MDGEGQAGSVPAVEAVGVEAQKSQNCSWIVLAKARTGAPMLEKDSIMRLKQKGFLVW